MTEDNAQLLMKVTRLVTKIATKARVQQGWCGDGPTDENGNQCVLIHAQEVTVGAGLERYKATATALAKRLPKRLSNFTDIGAVGYYNDLPSTTQQDIENLIDKTLAGRVGGTGMKLFSRRKTVPATSWTCPICPAHTIIARVDKIDDAKFEHLTITHGPDISWYRMPE